MTRLYYLLLAYLAIMAATGLYLRDVMPENEVNREHYVGYLVLLSALWPVTLVASLTNNGDGF